MKVIPGKKTELASVKSPKPVWDKSEKRRWEEDKKDCCEKAKDTELFFSHLYCNMACRGWIELAPDFAKKLGFSDEEIKEYGDKILSDIRKTIYYPYLVQLNGREF